MTVAAADREASRRRGLGLAWFTVGWDVVEGVAAVTADLAASRGTGVRQLERQDRFAAVIVARRWAVRTAIPLDSAVGQSRDLGLPDGGSLRALRQ